MKLFISLCLVCSALSAFAQKFYFPKEYHQDSISLEKNLPIFAKQIIAQYKEADRKTYWNNLIRLQTVAQEYRNAANSVDSFRTLVIANEPLGIKGIYFQYQSYAYAKILQAEKMIPFKEAYDSVFFSLFNGLSDQASSIVTDFFKLNPDKLKGDFNQALDNIGDKDSIGIEDALLICRTYNIYNVSRQIIPIGKSVVTAFENSQYFVDDSVLIKTRDGATIAATVIRKKNAAAKLPTIFVFNIYNSLVDIKTAKEAANKGYVGIVANTRGKRLSPEAIEPFEHDANDAYDIIDWISKQAWSNGQVGMFGGSYLGFSQWAAAKKVHPALKTIIPQVAVGIGIDYPMNHNVFMSYMLRWIHYVTNSKETDEADFNNEKHWDSAFVRWYVSGKSFRALDTVEGRPNGIFQRWLMHPSFDAYWQRMVAYKNDFSKINIPVLTTTGYYDADQLGALYYFNQHHLYNKNANHYLVIGPYDHGGAQGFPSSVLRGYTLDSVANIVINSLAYSWFDYILKDSAKPAFLKDNINYQVMGTNEWRHAHSLRTMNNDTLSFYLSNTRVSQHYQLAKAASKTPEFIRQEIDFKDRSDSIQTDFDSLESSKLDLSNGISFVTAPFAKDIDINGSFLGALHASINKKDMDVSITLYEVLPNGKYFFLALWIDRCSYANNRSVRKLLQPDKIETIPIADAFYISKKISAGSRLLVVLSIVKSPEWQINYGTGKDVSNETIEDGKIPLSIKWYNNSVIRIPVHRY